MATRFHPARVGAAVLGASLALMAAAPMALAAAQPNAKNNPAADVEGVDVKLVKDPQHVKTERTALLGLKLDGGVDALTYCVELSVNINTGADLHEVDPDQYPVADSPFKKNNKNVYWILNNAFPNVDVDALGKASGAPSLSKQEAIAGTQAAIWHYSDDVQLDEGNATPNNKDAAKDVVAVYKYLTGKDNTGQTDPTPSLKLTPSSLTGKSGDKIGPFTVTSTKDKGLDIKGSLPAGVQLVDENNVLLTSVGNGTKVFVKVPADAATGSGSFEVSGKAKVDKGRLFVGGLKDGNPITQSLVIATPVEVPLKDSAKANWTLPTTTTTTTPPPTTTTTTTVPPTPTTTTTDVVPVPASDNGPLPNTGASVIGAIIAGVVLIGAGVGALFFVRRRKQV